MKKCREAALASELVSDRRVGPYCFDIGKKFSMLRPLQDETYQHVVNHGKLDTGDFQRKATKTAEKRKEWRLRISSAALGDLGVFALKKLPRSGHGIRACLGSPRRVSACHICAPCAHVLCCHWQPVVMQLNHSTEKFVTACGGFSPGARGRGDASAVV